MDEATKQHRDSLIRAYRAAGEGFLAYKLEAIFTKIENEEDRIRHNDVLAEVLLMVENNPVSFMRAVAGIIMTWKAVSNKIVKKILTLHVADKVLNLSLKERIE